MPPVPPPPGSLPPMPSQIRTAATLEIVAGGLNLLLTWWLSSSVMTCVCGGLSGVVTMGMCPFGVVTGFLGWLLIPLGLIEILAGILILTDGRNARLFLGWLPVVQALSIFLGGVTSALMGLVVFVMMREPEAQRYLQLTRNR